MCASVELEEQARRASVAQADVWIRPPSPDDNTPANTPAKHPSRLTTASSRASQCARLFLPVPVALAWLLSSRRPRRISGEPGHAFLLMRFQRVPVRVLPLVSGLELMPTERDQAAGGNVCSWSVMDLDMDMNAQQVPENAPSG